MMRTVVAILVALGIVYFLTQTQSGSALFLKIKGSVASSTTGS